MRKVAAGLDPVLADCSKPTEATEFPRQVVFLSLTTLSAGFKAP